MSTEPNTSKPKPDEPSDKGSPATPPANSRRIKILDFLGGLPAVLAAAGLLGGLAWEARRGSLVKAYEDEATARIQANDLQSALVLLKRLVTLSDKPEYRFGLVMVYERAGDLGRAEFLARTLAPLDPRKPDEVEFQPARFWLARRLVLSSGRQRQRMVEGEAHLKRLIKANPNNLVLKATMGEFYFLTGRAREARPFLEAVAANNPDYLVKLAGVCSILGDKEEADRRANQAIEIARPIAEKDPKNLPARIHWANATVVKEQYEDALKILADADPPKEAKQLVDQTRSVICAAWADALAKNKASTSAQLDVILKGLQFDPSNAALHTRVAGLLQSQGEDYERVQQVMKKLLQEERSPGLIHFALGNDHWTRGRLAEARKEWELAIESKFPMPLAANNLAWSLAYLDPIDKDRALKLIEKAAADVPGSLEIRGTHGQVLTKVGRYEDAVPKLEDVIKGGQGTPGIHRALADAYDNMNKPVLASEHRRIADELTAGAPPAQPVPVPGGSKPDGPAADSKGKSPGIAQSAPATSNRP